MITSSSKPSLLFVDHIFHKKTKSADFIIEILEREFSVHRIFLDPDEAIDRSKLIDDREFVLIWQMDFLTPIFIAAGKKVVVAQMYDGSAGLPDDHWRLNRQARYLNFSVALHARALRLGLKSHLVRFFPDTENIPEVSDYTTRRAFFWQRLPNSSINVGHVKSMLGSQLDSIHIHTPADDGMPFQPESVEGFDCPVTTSDWFAKRRDFDKVLDSCNIFVAPRYGEGIGHAFLEAMARGMVVVAYDLPTHNEYIQNWATGILFNSHTGPIANLGSATLANLGRNARYRIQVGRKAWTEQQPGLCNFIKGAEAAEVPASSAIDSNIDDVILSYQAGVHAYTESLKRHSALINVLGSWRDLSIKKLHSSIRQDQALLPAPVYLALGVEQSGGLILKGWSSSEMSHRWAVNREASIMLPINRDGRLKKAKIDMRGVGPYQAEIHINGFIQNISVDEIFQEYELDFTDNPIMLSKTKGIEVKINVPHGVDVPQVESRPLTFAVRSLRLEFD